MKEFKNYYRHGFAYNTYVCGNDKLFPNSKDEINKKEEELLEEETRLVATFNVISTSSATKIMDSEAPSQFSEIEIDGVVQPSVVSNYIFDTIGEHIVKYTLSDPTSIGTSAFYGCSGLTSITIPNTVTSIGGGVFRDCSSLTSITIPDSITSIGNSAFGNCSSLTSITIPSGVTSIGNWAFSGCIGLTSITIPDSVTYIGQSAFVSCSSLTSIIIPDSLTSIGIWAFSGCTGLTSVTIGNSVTTIGAQAFSGCSGLTSVTSLATAAPTIQNDTFQNIKTGGTLYVPEGTTVTGYGAWMRTDDYYLGKYGWNIVEV